MSHPAMAWLGQSRHNSTSNNTDLATPCPPGPTRAPACRSLFCACTQACQAMPLGPPEQLQNVFFGLISRAVPTDAPTGRSH